MEVLFKQVPQDLTNLGMPRLECGDTGAEIVHWGKSDVQELIQDKVTEGGVGGATSTAGLLLQQEKIKLCTFDMSS